MKFRKALLNLVVISGIGMSSTAVAGGLFLYEIGTDNASLANAGSAARAQGPSTIASNPAGLSYLAGTQISTGAQALWGDFDFSANSQTNVAGADSNNILALTPAANFFASHQLDERWTLGFGSYGDFGLNVNYDNDWQGRYFIQNAGLIGMSFVPSAAYKINEQWSVGVGAKAMYAMMDSQLAIDRSPLNFLDRDDATMQYQDNTWGYGATAGLIFQPCEKTRVGLAYTSSMDLDFEDRLDIDNANALLATINGTQTKLDMTVPQTVTLSLYHQLNEKWALLASTNWQNWSEFGEIYVDIDTNGVVASSGTVDANYDDTWHLSLGTQYKVSDKLLWNAGVAHDTSMVSDNHRSFAVPVQATSTVGTGFTYSVRPGLDLNANWDLAWIGDMSVDQTKSLSGQRVSGEFDDAWIQTVSASATWRY